MHGRGPREAGGGGGGGRRTCKKMRLFLNPVEEQNESSKQMEEMVQRRGSRGTVARGREWQERLQGNKAGFELLGRYSGHWRSSRLVGGP
jgi:hypothetical protein